jgi:hypothetical protein
MNKFTSRILLVFALVFALIVPSFGQFGLSSGQARSIFATRMAQRTGGWVVIDPGGSSLSNATKTPASNTTWDIYRTPFTNTCGHPIAAIRVVYSNRLKSGSTENATNDLNLMVSAEEFGSTASTEDGAMIPGTFNGGSATGRILANNLLISDPIPFALPVAGKGFIRSGVQVFNVGDKYPNGNPLFGGATGTSYGRDDGGALAVDQATSTLMTGGSMSNQNSSNCWSPVAILAIPADGAYTSSLYCFGDSIANGTDDGGYAGVSGGWVRRAVESIGVGAGFGTSGGELMQTLVNRASSTKAGVRWRESQFFSHILWQPGRNDLAGRTLAQLKADCLTAAARCTYQGQAFAACTILPQVGTSDNYATYGNMSPDNSSVRSGYNSWLRDTSSTGFKAQANAQIAGRYAVIDPCIDYECDATGTPTLNGGYTFASNSWGLLTGTATTGSGLSTFVVNGGGMAVNAYRGKVLWVTSGALAGTLTSIRENSATTLTVRTLFGSNPASGVSFTIGDPWTSDGTHPTTKAHTAIAAGRQASILAFLAM